MKYPYQIVLEQLNFVQSEINKVFKTSLENDEKNECYHQCTSNCRRVGCNCECGEWHELNK